MILQTRIKVTAQELAEELEVSERTIYRDITALSTAGVPVYTERGPGGGCALLESYRTNLTGLTRNEVRALFMLSIPTQLTDLGLGQELKAALLKLSAALPSASRQDEERVRQRIHLDSVWWDQPGEPVPHLQAIHQAVWEDRKINITTRLSFGAQIEWLVDPYGLVAKSNVWYLVYAREGYTDVVRITRIIDAHMTDDRFERPDEFDLTSFWKTWCEGYERNRPHFPVIVRVSPELLRFLPDLFGESVRDQLAKSVPSETDGWVKIKLQFETLESARNRVLGLGRAIEVLEPVALRKSCQIADLYEAGVESD
jgi:predicted DNA-binding transcriptional regulator YafY